MASNILGCSRTSARSGRRPRPRRCGRISNTGKGPDGFSMIDLARLPRPEPSAGLAAYEAEREACLALEPRKSENWNRYQASSRRSAAVDYLPVKLDIENVSRCNFACTMCVVSTWPKGKRVDSGVNEIDISIDGADAATFEGIRVQSDFGRVKDNCVALNAYAASMGLKRTKMWTLVQKTNVKHLVRHVQLSAKLGFSNCVFSLNLHGWGNEALAARNAAVQADGELTTNYLLGLVELGRMVGVRVSFWAVNEKFDTDEPAHLCQWPFERAVVTSDLRTVPCCMIGDPDAFEFERGAGKSFGAVWNGKEYMEFRQAHLEGKIPKVCKGCYK